MNLDARSEKNLTGVHPDLVRVVRRAAILIGSGASIGFTVIEGLRSLDRQKELVKAGASKTMRSRHLTGHAVDLAATVAGKIRWDWPLYARIAAIVKQAADDEKVPLEWGGDWPRFKDGPHFQLPLDRYPAA